MAKSFVWICLFFTGLIVKNWIRLAGCQAFRVTFFHLQSKGENCYPESTDTEPETQAKIKSLSGWLWAVWLSCSLLLVDLFWVDCCSSCSISSYCFYYWLHMFTCFFFFICKINSKQKRSVHSLIRPILTCWCFCVDISICFIYFSVCGLLCWSCFIFAWCSKLENQKTVLTNIRSIQAEFGPCCADIAPSSCQSVGDADRGAIVERMWPHSRAPLVPPTSSRWQCWTVLTVVGKSGCWVVR